MKYTNIYYFYYISDIGGTETFLYELAKKYKDIDLTIVYRFGNQDQLNRLRQYAKCVQYYGQEIECEKAFFNYGMDIIDHVHAKDYYFEQVIFLTFAYCIVWYKNNRKTDHDYDRSLILVIQFGKIV